jgi:hypothetical protein
MWREGSDRRDKMRSEREEKEHEEADAREKKMRQQAAQREETALARSSVRRGGGYLAREQGSDRQLGRFNRSTGLHHDGSPRRGGITAPRAEMNVTMKPLDGADIEEGTEMHQLVEDTEVSHSISRAGGVRTAIQRPNDPKPRIRVGGGYDNIDDYEQGPGLDEEEPASPGRHTQNNAVREHRRTRTSTSKMSKRKRAKAPDHKLPKVVMWFLLLHTSIEIWGLACAFRDWFACNFYPEYTDLMWDVLCGAAVAITAACVVGSTVGCDCICCTMVKSYEKVHTRGSNWPNYLYTIACLFALAVAVFGAHPTVISNDPLHEELSVTRGPLDGPDAMMEGSGISQGRRQATEQEAAAAAAGCVEEDDDEPIAWCVSASPGVPLDQAAVATDECTNVMKYAACDDGVTDESCAEAMPYPTFHVQAEAGRAQNACILNGAGELCKYEFSLRHNVIPCPPPPLIPPPPPPPPTTHGYTIIRCVESIWTARVLVLATICRVIGAICATLVSLVVFFSAPKEYTAMGALSVPTAEPTHSPEPIKYDSTHAELTVNGRLKKLENPAALSPNTIRADGATRSAETTSATTSASPARATAGPQGELSLSPILNQSPNQRFITPARHNG